MSDTQAHVDTYLPGSTLGILGSGQLGRMTAMAAKHMGYRVVVLGPDPNDPAAQVADESVVGDLADPDAGLRLADRADVITLEFENASTSVLTALQEKRAVRPGSEILSVTQHRLREKQAMRRLEAPIARFASVNTPADLDRALAEVGCPCMLKTTTGGYDGKGQVLIESRSEAQAAFTRLGAGEVDLIAEAYVPFTKELSVVVARGPDGRTSAFPVSENEHQRNILHRSIVPARVSPSVHEKAQALARRIAAELGVVGLVAVEMFLVEPEELLVNELAPRPHNSGHYSLDACATSQFEQHVRAVCGLPLGSTEQHLPSVMVNILGEHLESVLENYRALLEDPYLKIHLYGKAEARPGRKMGHLTVLGATVQEALGRAERAWSTIAGEAAS